MLGVFNLFFMKMVLVIAANFEKKNISSDFLTRNIFEKNVENIKNTRNTMRSILTF